ncbi:DHS-like NAD/FAD-binding domain-containing protein [Hypoxylon sp. FL1284]|nr:DHS-like NAD/FAD-binding domain-containing protein [Hypoxylon sp. FL1284]
MADTAPKVAAEERQEDSEALEKKAEALAELIGKSKHLVVFTGAGISTSAGIPDFRGPDGVWMRRAQGRQRTGAVDTLQAVPTAAHMALVELQDRGVLKYLVSQNCDGLHRRSGILPDMISELHGNNNRESCKGCGKEYIRDFRAVASYAKTVRDHRTGRRCALCGGALLDSIVNFGEPLPAAALARARGHAAAADVFLVLGSSLTVSPANEIPEEAVAGGRRKRGNGRKAARLVICNLQDTPLDTLADLRVYARADDLVERVMAHIGAPIPPFVLRRRLVVQTESAGGERRQLRVSGVDVDGTPATFLRSVRLEHNRRAARSEPFVIGLREDPEPGAELRLELEFMGHYGEPTLDVVYEYGGDDDVPVLYLLEYNPQNGEWKVARETDAHTGHEARSGVKTGEDTNMGAAEAGSLPRGLGSAFTGNGHPEVIVID